MSATQVSVSTEDKEVTFDRRIRWAKEIVIGIVLATAWLLRLEWGQKSERDANVEIHRDTKKKLDVMDSSIDLNSKEIYGLQKDVEWLKEGRCAKNGPGD